MSSRACDCKSVPGGYVLIWVPDIFVGLLVSRALLCWSWCIFSKQFWIYCVKIEYIFWRPSSKCQYAFCNIWEVLLDFKLLCSNVDWVLHFVGMFCIFQSSIFHAHFGCRLFLLCFLSVSFYATPLLCPVQMNIVVLWLPSHIVRCLFVWRWQFVSCLILCSMPT